MPQNRIIYACQAVAISKTGHSNADTPQFEVMKGVQSVGINTTFSLEQVFELGQADLYANIEDVSDVEVTLEKVIDGEKLLYLQSVGENGKTNVIAASNSICDVYLAIYADSVSSVSGATKQQVVMCSGMTVSNVSYNYSVDDNAKESVTLVGNNKFWNSTTAGVIGTSPSTLYGTGGITIQPLKGDDVPVSGIVRRGQFDLVRSIIPPEVASQGNNIVGSSGIQSVAVSIDFGRENQLELGRFGPYNKTATLPFEVTTEFEVIATNGDLVSISGAGTSLSTRQILIRDTAGTVLDMGSKNRLTSVSYQGGDTGGGNATVSYSYSTFNDLKVNGGGTYWS